MEMFSAGPIITRGRQNDHYCLPALCFPDVVVIHLSQRPW